jgi:hypothetical protein
MFGKQAPTSSQKLGVNTSTDRTIGTAPAPSPALAGAEVKTEVNTYIAKPASDGTAAVLYNGDRQYARVTLVLETAGPVVVGTKQQLYPVTSGKGERLDTGVPFTFNIAKGDRIWVATTSINRIKVQIGPVPWLEQITGLLGGIVSQVTGVLGGLVSKITGGRQ